MDTGLFLDGEKHLCFVDAVDALAVFYNESPEDSYCLIVATDSQPHRQYSIFATSVILHRVGKGATFLVKKDKVNGKMHMRARIWEEAKRSIEMAQEFVEWFESRVGKNNNVEIHIDTSPAGKTRDMIRALTGFVESQGFTARVKPDAPGVRVADRFTK